LKKLFCDEMLRDRTKFFAEETDSSLLNLNQGFLESSPNVKERADGWLRSLGLDPPKGFPEPINRKPFDEKALRKKGRVVLMRDADRTFRTTHNRETFIQCCDVMWTKLADYQQTEGYIAGMLLLFYDIKPVIQALTVLATHPKYLPGYFKHEPTALNIDAWMWFDIVKEKMPAFHTHILKVGVRPDFYCQKYFGGLFIHVLPFKPLYGFLDGFFEHGFRWSLAYSLGLIQILEPVLLKITQHSELLDVLRLDPKLAPSLLAKHGGLTLQNVYDRLHGKGVEALKVFAALDIQDRREKAYIAHLATTMARAVQMDVAGLEVQEEDEIVFSSEEETDEDKEAHLE